MTKAEDVLRVLSGTEDLSVLDLRFTVITDALRRYWPFERGEIIVNHGDGTREPFGEGRKPDKWDVAVESFESLAEAEDCRRKVLANEWPQYYADWPREGSS